MVPSGPPTRCFGRPCQLASPAGVSRASSILRRCAAPPAPERQPATRPSLSASFIAPRTVRASPRGSQASGGTSRAALEPRGDPSRSILALIVRPRFSAGGAAVLCRGSRPRWSCSPPLTTLGEAVRTQKPNGPQCATGAGSRRSRRASTQGAAAFSRAAQAAPAQAARSLVSRSSCVTSDALTMPERLSSWSGSLRMS
jgi:hypothetical protein